MMFTSHSHSLNCLGTFTHMYVTRSYKYVYCMEQNVYNWSYEKFWWSHYRWLQHTYANFQYLYVFGFVLDIYLIYRHLNHIQLWFKLKHRHLALVETLFTPSHSSKCLLSGIMVDGFRYLLCSKLNAIAMCCQQKLVSTTTTKSHLYTRFWNINRFSKWIFPQSAKQMLHKILEW